MIDWLKSLFSDPNGKASSRRICALICVLNFAGLAIFDVVFNHSHFDPLASGQGVALLIGAISALLGVEQIGK